MLLTSLMTLKATIRFAASRFGPKLGLRALVCTAFIGVGAGANAASVQVQVQDGAGNALPDAVVFLESTDATRARVAAKPLTGVEIAQVNRQFEPRILVVPQGTSVQFPNRDSVRHHVYSFSAAKNFELKLYSGTPANPVTFDKTGIAVLGCNIHDNMVAWVVVVDTPYFGRSAAMGQVALPNVPVGAYRLRVWHPNLPVGAPALDQALNVDTADATVTVRMAGLAR
jgi:plastocyanin